MLLELFLCAEKFALSSDYEKGLKLMFHDYDDGSVILHRWNINFRAEYLSL